MERDPRFEQPSASDLPRTSARGINQQRSVRDNKVSCPQNTKCKDSLKSGRRCPLLCHPLSCQSSSGFTETSWGPVPSVRAEPRGPDVEACNCLCEYACPTEKNIPVRDEGGQDPDIITKKMKGGQRGNVSGKIQGRRGSCPRGVSLSPEGVNTM